MIIRLKPVEIYHRLQSRHNLFRKDMIDGIVITDSGLNTFLKDIGNGRHPTEVVTSALALKLESLEPGVTVDIDGELRQSVSSRPKSARTLRKERKANIDSWLANRAMTENDYSDQEQREYLSQLREFTPAFGSPINGPFIIRGQQVHEVQEDYDQPPPTDPDIIWRTERIMDFIDQLTYEDGEEIFDRINRRLKVYDGWMGKFRGKLTDERRVTTAENVIADWVREAEAERREVEWQQEQYQLQISPPRIETPQQQQQRQSIHEYYVAQRRLTAAAIRRQKSKDNRTNRYPRYGTNTRVQSR